MKKLFLFERQHRYNEHFAFLFACNAIIVVTDIHITGRFTASQQTPTLTPKYRVFSFTNVLICLDENAKVFDCQTLAGKPSYKLSYALSLDYSEHILMKTSVPSNCPD